MAPPPPPPVLVQQMAHNQQTNPQHAAPSSLSSASTSTPRIYTPTQSITRTPAPAPGSTGNTRTTSSASASLSRASRTSLESATEANADDERKVSTRSSWIRLCAWIRSLLCSLFTFTVSICAIQRLSRLNSRARVVPLPLSCHTPVYSFILPCFPAF